MGNRISIQFKRGEDLSGVLFSHWDGMEIKNSAEDYVRELITDRISKGNDSQGLPLDRLESETVMISFISEIVCQGSRITSNYYLPEGHGGDNSDNGHHIIDIDEIEAYLFKAANIKIDTPFLRQDS